MAYSADDITLYVPCYNPGEALVACVESIRAQTLRPARFLLVDDGSTRPVSFPGIETLLHPLNRGLAAARNSALTACGTSLLAALDADVVAAPDWLERMLKAIDSSGAAGVGGCMVEHYRQTLGDRWRAVHMAQNWGGDSSASPRFLFGANTLFQTSALRQVGGFDECCRTNNEDRTLSDSLHAAGYSLFYAADARCEHFRRDTAATVLRGYWQWHHAKGLKEGDFDSPQGVLGRVNRVNVGIFKYRFELDRAQGREDLLGLDLLIPWVFCAQDLAMLNRRTGEPVPDTLGFSASVDAPDVVREILKDVLPRAVGGDGESWHAAYGREFEMAMRDAGWSEKAQAGAVSLAETLREIRSLPA